MVVPSLHHARMDLISKQSLRNQLRSARHDHVAAIPETVRALLFKRPPAPLFSHIPDGAVIGLYHAVETEAPTASYARFFYEAGHPLALPFLNEDGVMEFRSFTDPFEESDLEQGPHSLMQPAADAQQATPDVLFVPLLGFTQSGARIGQGGGHYDRWLANHPESYAIGMAWDGQLVDDIPLEPHDMPLRAIVTPTRLYGPFDA